jgi:lysophospholipase L1-like esterase
MSPPMRRLSLLVAVACSLLAAGPALADPSSPTLVASAAVSAPWESELAAFARSDLAHPPAAGGILFVGSSSIRLWSGLEQSFGTEVGVIKRGFGGSQLRDCVGNLERLVVKYRPRVVLLYAGDNDIAAGATPEDVQRRFLAFVDGVRARLPDTRIGYISIKPSPSRSALLPSIRAANELIRASTATRDNVEFIDVFTPMVGTDGAPRGELFGPDALHLNADGYALWKSVIAPYVTPG